jgi:hypothetical protein
MTAGPKARAEARLILLAAGATARRGPTRRTRSRSPVRPRWRGSAARRRRALRHGLPGCLPPARRVVVVVRSHRRRRHPRPMDLPRRLREMWRGAAEEPGPIGRAAAAQLVGASAR